MSERVYNFNPGPAALPLAVLEQVQKELLDFKGTGMSILEISHRSKEYEEVNTEAEALMKELLGAPDNYRVLFLQGGASTQFAMVPLNYLLPGSEADYVITGGWAEKAYEEAAKIGKANIAASSKGTNFDRIPKLNEIKLSSNPAYVHITTNNTLYGTEWHTLPDFPGKTLIADMSSNFLSKPVDISKFGLIYAGAQKNVGPAGVTIVIIRQDLIEKANKNNVPTMLQYGIHAKNNSLYNTPPVFAVYIVNLVLKYLKNNGGLEAIEKQNKLKAGYVYDAIDSSGGFYKGHAQPESRSLMNITFTLPNEDLDKAFIAGAKALKLVGLKGHRSVGGMRASTYNAVPVEGCKILGEFMKDFAKRNG
ncbi:MAG: 3-phosphoserine/phosphohydroxythreonine transaminase [Firmicutes bacterium]|nr:3-phosphoserine/phosphohydroxythreonine transaminase [Bacillota bacterium]